MSWYFSKERRIKRNEKSYKLGRNKIAIRYALAFAFGFFIVRSFFDFMGDKSLSIDNYFNLGRLFQFVFNILFMYLVAYNMIWSQIEDDYEKNKEKRNEK